MGPRPSAWKHIRCTRISSTSPSPFPSCFEGISLRLTVTNISNIRIENCFFADIRQPYSAYQSSGDAWARAVGIDGYPVRDPRRDLRARACDAACKVDASPPPPPPPLCLTVPALSRGRQVRNVSIVNNVATRLDTFFFSRSFVDGLLIDGNTVRLRRAVSCPRATARPWSHLPFFRSTVRWRSAATTA